MAFSIEPGIYPGPHGARIEDIVVCADPSATGLAASGAGYLRMNNAPRELVIV
jgi:Xaa-Pro aminopeptidase